MTLKLQAGVCYGSARGRLTAPGFRYTESAYEPGMNLPSHSHELAHFCLVLKGSYTERLGSKSEERRPSTLIFYPPDTVSRPKSSCKRTMSSSPR
jgi:quercetin dioxygenase-like cupin family protein